MACLGSLSRVLKPDLLGLERPAATRAAVARVKDADGAAVLASVEYAAAFWTEHLVAAMERGEGGDASGMQDDVQTFLQTRLLEWLECLSLGDIYPRRQRDCGRWKRWSR